MKIQFVSNGVKMRLQKMVWVVLVNIENVIDLQVYFTCPQYLSVWIIKILNCCGNNSKMVEVQSWNLTVILQLYASEKIV